MDSWRVWVLARGELGVAGFHGLFRLGVPYRTQQYATAVYRSELASRLKELGYEIEHAESSQPEINLQESLILNGN